MESLPSLWYRISEGKLKRGVTMSRVEKAAKRLARIGLIKPEQLNELGITEDEILFEK